MCNWREKPVLKASTFRSVQPADICKYIYHPQNAFTTHSVVGVILTRALQDLAFSEDLNYFL